MSADELLDVVDEHDAVIGTATRREIHTLGLRHRAVHVLVYDHARQLYVQRRSLAKDCSPGLWDTSAAGHVDSGEDYATAAVRELDEELGVASAVPLEPLFAIAASPETGNEFVRVYRAHVETDVVPDPVEIIEGRWLDDPALDAWLGREPAKFTPTFRRIRQRLTSVRNPGPTVPRT